MVGHRIGTLAQAITETAAAHPDCGFTFQNLEGVERYYSFAALDEATARHAAGLQALGLRKGDRLGLIILLPEDFCLTFLAALRVGIVPVPLYPPLYLTSTEVYLEHTARILRSCGARMLCTSSSLLPLTGALRDKVDTLGEILDVAEVARVGATAPLVPQVIEPRDLAFLQYTSGSTSDPKGVMVSHASLVGNIHGFMGAGLAMVPGVDVGVSWLPLYHDMGLVGFMLGPVYWGVSVVFIPTIRFAVNASVWLDTIHRHRGTVSFGPNFAYALALRKAKPAQLEAWDLSCVKAFGCGAEPISPNTLREFARVFGDKCGLRPSAMMPAYGLAESTLAVTMKPLAAVMSSQRVDAGRFQKEGRAEPSRSTDALEHVSVGVPFPGHELEICGRDGAVLPDGREGEIRLRGPSLTTGYFRDPGLTAELMRGGWLHTGDLGYLRDGELYVTGRIKDLIIINGRNVHPQSIEWAVSEVHGVRRGNVVAFSRPSDEGEEIVVAVEVTRRDSAQLRAEVDEAVRRLHAVPRVEVVCLKPGALPKTSSGKLKRQRTRELYLNQLLAGSKADIEAPVEAP